jgi:tetratricopeptide (TPR) repeat protein
LLSRARLFSIPPVTRTAVLFLLLAGTASLRAHPELAAALDRVNALIAALPDEAEFYIDRGDLYAEHLDWVPAEANYLRAAELAPNLPRLDRARAALELATGRAKDARVKLDRTLARNPHDPQALLLRSRALAKLAAPDAALADLTAALALVSAPPPELFLERAALIRSPAEAIRSLDEGIARVGPAPALHLRALALEESSGRIDAALARIDSLAAASERKESWLKRRGDLLARAGRQGEARAAYASALAAIATLPAWLRESPDLAQLATELTRLAAPAS